ncbi:MAG: YdcF family protein [Candidatus Parcubacteria bacterium]|nr:YdcF family protein [Candidatus Parcubacteria bacterium]
MNISREEMRKNLQKEFEQCYLSVPKTNSPDIEGVVILSHVDYNFDTEDMQCKFSNELISRIEYGAKMFLDSSLKPFLIMDGCRSQLLLMQERATSLGVRQDQIYLLDGGDIASSNTKKQIEALRDDPIISKMKKIVFITNTYHVPRVRRTASLLIPENISFDVFGVPNDISLYDKQNAINGEIERILKYIEKGDIAITPR